MKLFLSSIALGCGFSSVRSNSNFRNRNIFPFEVLDSSLADTFLFGSRSTYMRMSQQLVSLNSSQIGSPTPNPTPLPTPYSDMFTLQTPPTGYLVVNIYTQDDCRGTFVQEAYGFGFCISTMADIGNVSYYINATTDNLGITNFSVSGFLSSSCTGFMFGSSTFATAQTDTCQGNVIVSISTVSPSTFTSGAVIANYVDSACTTKPLSYSLYPVGSCFLLDPNITEYAVASCNATSGQLRTFKDDKCLLPEQSFPSSPTNRCSNEYSDEDFYGEFGMLTCMESGLTVQPTTNPSKIPSGAPTPVPNAPPTPAPSPAPSTKPSSLPSAPPTPAPSTGPTKTPTFIPTLQTVPVVKFSSQVSMQGLSTQSLPDSSVAVVLGITAALMKVPTSSVTFAGVSFTSSRKLATGAAGTEAGRTAGSVSAAATVRDRPAATSQTQASRSFLRDLSGYTAVVAMNVAIQASLFPTASSPSDIYTTVTSALSTAAATGQFTTALVAAAVSANITSLTQATVTSVASSAPVIVSPPSFSPTLAPTKPVNGNTLLAKYIIIIVVLGFALIVAIAKGIHFAVTGNPWPFPGGYKAVPPAAPESAESMTPVGVPAAAVAK